MQSNLRIGRSTSKCDKISLCLVSSLFSGYAEIPPVMMVFCHENACFVTTDLETQSSFPRGNIINTLNSAIPEADKLSNHTGVL